MNSTAIQLAFEPPLCEISLNRPEKQNALSIDMWLAIPDLVKNAMQNNDVKVIILHGGHADMFCSGADISEFAECHQSRNKAWELSEAIADGLRTLETCTKPTIAAIEGNCIGGGVSIAMACDMRVAGKGSRLGVTPAKIGMVYPPGDTRRLMAAIGPGATKDMLFTGRLLDADEANSNGLIDHLVETGSALSKARDLALKIASNSQWSTKSIKRMIQGLQSGWEDSNPEAVELFLEGFTNCDFEEGHRAFLDKRKPDFKFK